MAYYLSNVFMINIKTDDIGRRTGCNFDILKMIMDIWIRTFEKN